MNGVTKISLSFLLGAVMAGVSMGVYFGDLGAQVQSNTQALQERKEAIDNLDVIELRVKQNHLMIKMIYNQLGLPPLGLLTVEDPKNFRPGGLEANPDSSQE